MKKLNKKPQETNELKSIFDSLFNNNEKQSTYINEYAIECKNKCLKLSTDKKRKMVGFDFEYVSKKCDKINEYIEDNSDSYLCGNYKVIIGGKSEYELKYKELYAQEQIRLILENVKTKPIEYFESYVNGVKHLKQESKIYENSQILVHDDDDEIAIQASYNL